jgi:hypothetical protein
MDRGSKMDGNDRRWKFLLPPSAPEFLELGTRNFESFPMTCPRQYRQIGDYFAVARIESFIYRAQQILQSCSSFRAHWDGTRNLPFVSG